MKTIRLWDLPVRLFHWLLVVAVIGAIATVKLGGSWMEWHERFGLMVLALLSFRVIWGFVGSRHAQFASFVRGPSEVRRYLRGEWQGVGHNPLGALSVLALIGLFALQAVTGLFATDDIAFNGPLYRAVSSEWNELFTSWHKLAEWLIYGLIALHILAVMYYTHVRKDNLVKPMITGRKPVPEGRGEDTGVAGINAFLFAVAVAAGVIWVATGGLLPPPPPPQDLGW